MPCKYVYNLKVYEGYDTLIDELSNTDIESALSILFSLDTNKLDKIYTDLNSIKLEYKFRNTQSMSDGSPDIEVGNRNFTTQTIIDSGIFTINGQAPMFRMDNDEFVHILKDIDVRNGMTKEEAELKSAKTLEHWDKIAKDSSDLHRIIVSSTNRDDDRHFSGSSINTAFSGIFDQLRPLVLQIEKDIWKRNTNSKLIRNFNFEADLKGRDEKIVGHIDYLFIKDNGDIEIFNIKSSTENENDWGAVKLEKFKYQLAFLKRMLEFHGINAKNIRVNIIPVKLKYDDNFENVLEVSSVNSKPYDVKDSTYTFQKYDDAVAQFIDSKAVIEDIDDNIFIKVNDYLNKIFPNSGINIRYNGIKQSAKGWIKHHWKLIALQPTEGRGWNIKLPGEKEFIHIDDTRVGEDNEELVRLVLDREEELFGTIAQEKATYRVVQDIQSSYRHGLSFFGSSFEGATSGYLEKLLLKYFEKESNSEEYKWELVDNDTLTNANIILFRHKATNQVDVVTLTPFDVGEKYQVKNRKNLLGYYLSDMNEELFDMESNYGNIEAIRTLTLLNEVVPKLNFSPKLGSLRILGLSSFHKKRGTEFNIATLLSSFDTVVRVINENNLVGMPNNFKTNKVEGIDWSQWFILIWREIVNETLGINNNDIKGLDSYILTQVKADGTIVDGLETIEQVEGKIEKLNSILDALARMSNGSFPLSGLGLIEASRDTKNIRKAAIAKLYMATLKALQMYNGDYSLTNEEITGMDEYVTKPLSIPNTNVRTVAYLFQKSVNKIADSLMTRYSPIREIIMLYYKDSGYTPTLNSLVGNQAKQFDNLYELDTVTGEKTMRFKNPYDNGNNLKSHEREFLKKILWELNKVRAEMKGMNWTYSSYNDSRLIDDIKKGKTNYLDVPLERASKATQRRNLKLNIIEAGKRWAKRIMNPKEAFQEFEEEILSDEEKQIRDRDLESLQAYNPFANQESPNVRTNLLDTHGVDYFETNVENIMIDFLEKHILSVEYNKMLTRAKAIMLDLHLRGIAEDDKEGVEHTVQVMEDFLSVSVFNKSIMNESSQKIDTWLAPLRRAVTKCYIMGNVTGMFRDTFEGFTANMIRALTKFQTDINAKDVLYGYKEIVKEGPGNLMKITKYSLLNLKYRLSNLDVARISEGLKTGKGGINNWENWAFYTLRAPDYLNRMVLFAARMKHDGCEDAYIIENGKLKYDMRRDKRFMIYLSGDTSNPEYAKLRSLYLSLLRAFNQENNTKLVEGDDLPDAYTLLQIDAFKNFADNIYGSYNQSLKWKMENVAIGRNFTVYSTWMNGIWDVYSKKRQLSNSELAWVQDKDVNGNLLYFDKYGRPVTLEEGGDPNTPVMTNVPILVQGCWYTLTLFYKEYRNLGLKGAWDLVTSNEVNLRNIHRMETDLLVALILGALFKMFITPAYKEHKATADGEDVVTNAIVEVLYKSSSNSFDGFKGPYNMLEYFGNSTNPATYKLHSKILNDTGNFLFGDKTFGEFVMGSQALPRSFNDTYQMWARDLKE